MSGSDRLERLRTVSTTRLGDADALSHVATLVDASADAAYPRGADRALHLLDELGRRELAPADGAVLEYLRANAWSVKEEALRDRDPWTWENPEREEQILALSRAADHAGFAELDSIRRCQILTNRAIQYAAAGRTIDAIEGWDAALAIVPRFALALINRGFGLKRYASLLEDDRERAIVLLHGYDALSAALSPDAIYDAEYPERLANDVAAANSNFARALDVERVRGLQRLDEGSLGRSRAEREYRRWCLDRRLFLNPLDDLVPFPAAAADDLVLPTLTERLGDRPSAVTPPPAIGFFNQMKQEYASARFMLYEGLGGTRTHFSDRGVRMLDTLDYPMHSLATERVRTALRVAFSLLDKVAFLVDHHWRLGKDPERIGFRNVWLAEGRSRLLERFVASRNLPLRGLYWLSKELFDERLKRTTAPDARDLHHIRNALEHRYLQVHEGWAWPLMRIPPSSFGVGISIGSDLLETKALRLMKMARTALIQVALAIGVEERDRARPKDGIVGSMPLYGLDDRRKRRDPLSAAPDGRRPVLTPRRTDFG